MVVCRLLLLFVVVAVIVVMVAVVVFLWRVGQTHGEREGGKDLRWHPFPAIWK